MGVIDSLDKFLTQARVNRQCRRAAARFERKCRPGTYYSIVECAQPWGDGPKVLTHRIVRTRWDGLKCGHMTPAALWLGYGPLYERDPAPHLERVFEKDGDHQSELNLKKALQALGRLQA